MSLFLHAGSPEAEAARKKEEMRVAQPTGTGDDIADDNNNKEVDENEKHASRCGESPCVFKHETPRPSTTPSTAVATCSWSRFLRTMFGGKKPISTANTYAEWRPTGVEAIAELLCLGNPRYVAFETLWVQGG
jgi:hypothetical protein